MRVPYLIDAGIPARSASEAHVALGYSFGVLAAWWRTFCREGESAVRQRPQDLPRVVTRVSGSMRTVACSCVVPSLLFLYFWYSYPGQVKL